MPIGNSSRSKLLALRTLLPKVEGIPAETVEVVQRRIAAVTKGTRAAYSYAEFQEIRARATTLFSTALVRLRANSNHLRRWHAGQFPPGSADWLIGEALEHLSRTGNVPRYSGYLQVPRRYERALGGSEAINTWGRLFLDRTEINAAITLLAASEGWNRSVIHLLRVPTLDPSVGDDNIDIYPVEINKRRRPAPLRYTSNNLLDSGPDTPGRLLSQLIEATEAARTALQHLGSPTDRLLVWHRLCGGIPIAVGAPNKCEIPSSTGELQTIHLHRIRRTVQVLIRKEPAQNTEHTHHSVYRLGDATATDETESVVAQGLNDAVEHAQIITQMRTQLTDSTPTLVELSDNPDLAAALARGELDTATGACTDLTNSPFTPAGQVCTASFLLCLACPNAVATRRHLPRLAHLHQTLQNLRFVVSPEVWDQDWQTHFVRLSSLLMTNTTAAERAAALQKLSTDDRNLIDRLLQRRLDP
ncbi:hypothetical protein [Mycobacteroides salmoniphilum]|uniref:hypothetical protein n=1 Tax=Mycobacteroides salmoniphilum TaxID=404941 RepID=UPI00106514A5|nr:hypothetical protein [Mycobacteroides salmoniphilum]